jgi:hypothetical protein
MIAAEDDGSHIWADQMATLHPSFVYQAAQALAQCLVCLSYSLSSIPPG